MKLNLIAGSLITIIIGLILIVTMVESIIGTSIIILSIIGIIIGIIIPDKMGLFNINKKENTKPS